MRSNEMLCRNTKSKEKSVQICQLNHKRDVNKIEAERELSRQYEGRNPGKIIG